MDRGAVVGQAAQDVQADGGGVARRRPGGDEAGEFVLHAAGGAVELGGEAGEGGDEGAGRFGNPGRLPGGSGSVRLGGRTVGGVLPGVFPWTAAGG